MTIQDTNYYRASATNLRSYPQLRGKHDTRICIIGAGFAGLNTALGLLERGESAVTLIDAQTIGFGASGRNGGFVFGGFSRDEASLLADLGPQRAKALYLGTQAAVSLIRERIATYAIDCQHTDAGVIWANWFRDQNILLQRQSLLAKRFSTQWHWIDEEQLREQICSERYHDGLFEQNALHFHPVNYAYGLARAAQEKGLVLFEQTPAIRLTRNGSTWQIHTPEGEIFAEHVVLACGGYLAKLRAEVDRAVLPIATYVMVTEPLDARMDEILTTRAAVYDSRFAFDYYRPLPDSRLLWGGRISVRDRSPDAVQKLLYRDLLKVFPQLDGVSIDYAWSGLMSYARHEMPQIGQIDQGLWLAQAFGGHGVAPTTFAGEILAAAIAENDTRWREFADYGLVSALKPAGFVGAQLTYWWLEAKDAWKAWREQQSQ